MSIRSMPDNQTIPLKLTFSANNVSISLDYVEFSKDRSGIEEVEISTGRRACFGDDARAASRRVAFSDRRYLDSPSGEQYQECK